MSSKEFIPFKFLALTYRSKSVRSKHRLEQTASILPSNSLKYVTFYTIIPTFSYLI